jgi:hypothetical protein
MPCESTVLGGVTAVNPRGRLGRDEVKVETSGGTGVPPSVGSPALEGVDDLHPLTVMSPAWRRACRLGRVPLLGGEDVQVLVRLPESWGLGF